MKQIYTWMLLNNRLWILWKSIMTIAVIGLILALLFRDYLVTHNLMTIVKPLLLFIGFIGFVTSLIGFLSQRTIDKLKKNRERLERYLTK